MERMCVNSTMKNQKMLQVDDAEYVETPTGNYYWIELEQGEKEVKVKINENGEFI